MSKGKSITLLTIISVLMSLLLVMTFLRFPIGVKDYNSPIGAVELDYDIAGGVAYTLALNENNEEEVDEQKVQEVVESIKSRLEDLGYDSYIVKPVKSTDSYVKDYEIRVEIKETGSHDEDMKAVAVYGALKFYGGTEASPATEILEDVKVIADSQYIGQSETGYVMSLVFTDEGAEELVKTIGDNETYYLRISCGLDEHNHEIDLFDGTIDKTLFDDGNKELSMNTSSESMAKRMALQLREGGLEYRYDILNDGVGVKIQTAYGEELAKNSLIAILSITLVAIIVLVIAYKGLGIVGALSFLLFAIAQAWLLIGVPGIIVNLGSIIGIIVAMIISLYTTFMLLQNIKDEYAYSEKTVKASISKGFKDSLVPTINVHVVSGIIALLLFIFTKGVVKSFAITCGIGIVVSAISTLVFTRMFNSIILPLPKNKEKFLKIKKVEKAVVEVE